MATKIRNTNKLFHAPALPQPPITYSAVYEAQKDNVLKFYFANIDEALSKALQFDTSDIIDGSIPNSKLENSTVSFGGVTVALGGSSATPAFNLSSATNYPAANLTGTIAGIQIAAGAVTESRLADDAVTTAKIADGAVNTDRLGTQAVTGAKIAANTIGSGNLGSNCVLTAAITDANVTTAKIADANITTAKIADDAVTDAKLADAINSAITANTAKVTNATHTGEVTGATALTIADGAVVTARLADDAVTTAKIADGAVNTDRLGTQAVTGAKIAANTIGSGNLGSNCVLTAAITDANVTTAKIADSAVTGAKIANTTITPDKLTGSITGSQLSTPITFTDGKTQEENPIVTITNSNTSGSQDGRMISMIAGSNFRGSLGYTEVSYGSGTFFAGSGCGLLATTQFSTQRVSPCDGIGDFEDNVVDLGSSSVRFDDIYATNGTIQTSDGNLKQDIEELSDAEKRVALAAKGLLRKFRWIDSVAEKGDNARIHFGIIAQDLEAAFTAGGLDAGKYAMFISTTWWEHEGEIYEEQAHIPEGVTATEVTRRGVRYPELLAFIIASL